MRYLVFNCRPCLSIRNQQTSQPLSRSIVRWSTQPNARTNPTGFLALQAFRRCKSTALETWPSLDTAGSSMTVQDPPPLPSYTRVDDSDLDAAYNEFEAASAAALARDAPSKRHADDEDCGSVPSAVGPEHWRNEHLTFEDQGKRSAEDKWDELEPLILGYDVAYEQEFKRLGDRGWGWTSWEWLCHKSAKMSRSAHELDIYNTAEEYLAAIYGDFLLRANRCSSERFAHNLFDKWFQPLAREMKPKVKKGFVLEPQPSCEEIEAMKKKWRSIPPRLRDLRWPGMITKCLKYAPRRLPIFVQVTTEHRIARPYILESVIRLLGNQVTYYRAQDKPDFADSAVMAMLCALRNTPPGHIAFSQETVWRMMKYASTPKVAELYRALKKYNWDFVLHTRMHFASRLAKDLRYRSEGLGIFRELVDKDGLDINSVTGSALATSLLSIQNDGPFQSRASPPPSVVEQVNQTLLALGLTPNIINFTAIIQTLCELKELSKAWEVYEFMVGQGVEADETLLLVLLHGSKVCLDYDSAKRVVEMAIKQGVHNRLFWNEVLHLVFSAALRGTPKARGTKRNYSVFAPMYFVYNKFFDPKPLQRLMVTNLRDHSLEAPDARNSLEVLWPHVRTTWPIISMLPDDREILEPGTDTLYIMLAGYIRGFTRPTDILHYWTRFQHSLKQGDLVARRMVKQAGAKLHNIILLSLCEHPDMLPNALEMLITMLNDTIEAEILRKRRVNDRTPRHPVPDIRAWGIVLHGFMRHRRHEEGEAILQMMYRHGIPPNISTWNQLLAGYARTRQVYKALDVMDRIQGQGLVPDKFTWSIFSSLNRNRETTALMRKMMIERQKLRNSQHPSWLYDDSRNGAIDEYTMLRDDLAGLSDDIAGRRMPTTRRPPLLPENGARGATPLAPLVPNIVRRVTR